MWGAYSTAGSATPGEVVLGCTRKLDEHELEKACKQHSSMFVLQALIFKGCPGFPG